MIFILLIGVHRGPGLPLRFSLLLAPDLMDIVEFSGRLVQPRKSIFGPNNQLIRPADIGGDAK
jgi:hypothetical protein